MQSKTLIGNQWQLDQGTKAVHVSQSATIQQDREISTDQKLFTFLKYVHTRMLYIIYTHKYLRHMYMCMEKKTLLSYKTVQSLGAYYPLQESPYTHYSKLIRRWPCYSALLPDSDLSLSM